MVETNIAKTTPAETGKTSPEAPGHSPGEAQGKTSSTPTESNPAASAVEGDMSHKRAKPGAKIAKSTIDGYYTNRDSLERQARKHLCLDIEETLEPAALVDWLITVKFPEVTAGSWRVYKASMLYTLEHSGTPDGLAAAETLRAFKGAQGTRKATGGKAKTMTDEDYDRLIRAIGESDPMKRRYDALLGGIFQAGIAVGLRPSEWGEAELLYSAPRLPSPAERDMPFFKKGPWLRVRNAKATQGRACGEFRVMNLAPLPPAILDTIKGLLVAVDVMVNEGNTPWSDIEKGMSTTLRRLCRKIWGKRDPGYTTYTPRHVFASRCKAVAGPAITAALMGHISDETASRHYGHRRSAGRKGSRLLNDLPIPIADPLSIVQVMEYNASAPKAASQAETALASLATAVKKDIFS